MTPQADIPIAATVLGAIGTVFWCIQLVPQIWTNWRTKSTDGLPGTMMFLWALCAVPMGAYVIIQNFNIPIQIQPQSFMALCLVSWSQTLIYGRKWTTWKAVLAGIIMAITFAGVEATLILTLRPPYKAGNEMAPTVIGIIAAILLAAGLLPPCDQIWRRRGRVVGINWLFLSMDFSGALFSLLALAAQNTFDVLGGVLYIVCCVLELGIFLSQLIWVFRTRQVRKRAATLGKTVGDILITCEVHGIPFKFAERGRRKTGLPDVELGKNQGKVQTVEQFQHEPA
ncbi:hypothetical protein SCUP515_04302 [Seiridium cupressi]